MIKQRYNRRYVSATGLIFLGLAVMAIMVLRPEASPGADQAPRAVISETKHDFGEVFEDTPLTHNFVIQNTGTAPLKILLVDPDCACTVPRYDQIIAPGGQGEMTLTIKPYSVLRKFRKETRVRFNDPERPEVSLVMMGVAKPFIEISPSHIVRLRGSPADDLRGQVRFTSHLPGFTITNYHTNIPDKIEVNLKAVEADRVYVLEVKNKSQNSGPYAGLIELTTTSKNRPRLIVRVFGEIYLPSAGSQ